MLIFFLFLVNAFFVIYSRIVMKKHYFIDIVFGIIIGFFVSFLTYFLF
jgi:membrane-associated phospholipid phosphatase